ncbi:KilA-N domain-containing protein [Flexithrix dorotheae]|uniref:KilA-N domain-containing protein n=1 Tax=Flexithrix dorotheae TaxID=70993 RepID=UPI000A03876A
MVIPITDVRKGGSNQSTWIHEKLVLKFAAWLSPEFVILFLYLSHYILINLLLICLVLEAIDR